MPRGSRSNDPAPWPPSWDFDNFAVDTPDGVHQTMFVNSNFMGPINLGPYQIAPGAPVMREGQLTGPVTRGARSGQGKTVTVK